MMKTAFGIRSIGMIPAKFHGPLLAIAKRKCVKLTADDLVYR